MSGKVGDIVTNPITGNLDILVSIENGECTWEDLLDFNDRTMVVMVDGQPQTFAEVRARKFKAFNGAAERKNHSEGKVFEKFFTTLLCVHTGSCWERDILRDNKEQIWHWWKAYALKTDGVEG